MDKSIELEKNGFLFNILKDVVFPAIFGENCESCESLKIFNTLW